MSRNNGFLRFTSWWYINWIHSSESDVVRVNHSLIMHRIDLEISKTNLADRHFHVHPRQRVTSQLLFADNIKTVFQDRTRRFIMASNLLIIEYVPVIVRSIISTGHPIRNSGMKSHKHTVCQFLNKLNLEGVRLASCILSTYQWYRKTTRNSP